MQTILAVDKEKNLVQIENILSEDYYVVPVNSGSMALKFLNQKIPHLLIIGGKMQDMDGIQLLIKLKEKESWSRIPILFITSHQGGEKKSFRSRGTIESVRRPLKPESLREQVRSILSRELVQATEYLSVMKEDKRIEVPIDKIQYIEIYNQIGMIRMQHQELETRMTLEQMKNSLGDVFLQMGASLLVNKKHMIDVTDGILYMENGGQLVLPRRGRQELVCQIKEAIASR